MAPDLTLRILLLLESLGACAPNPDFTGQQRAGLWVVGGTMVAAAIVTLVLRAAPEPNAPQSG